MLLFCTCFEIKLALMLDSRYAPMPIQSHRYFSIILYHFVFHFRFQPNNGYEDRALCPPPPPEYTYTVVKAS